MRNPFRYLLDAWSSLDYKSAVHAGPNRPYVAPTWVGDHARRLESYKAYDAYRRNRSASYLPELDQQDRREYGDAALVVAIVKSAVTGDDISLSVEGADADLDEEKATPQQKAEAAAAVARLEELEEWARNERLQMKIVETEEDAVALGDGVYALGINRKMGRVHLRCYDPGFYFPKLDPNGSEDEFPDRVDIAFQYEEQGPTGETQEYVHRITWELGPIVSRGVTSGGANERDDAEPVTTLRSYAWNDEPSDVTCYLTDAIWKVEDITAATGGQLRVDNFPLNKAQFVQNSEGVPFDRLDLELDFIPVVHLPNSIAIKEHFGESVLASVAQLLDDIQHGDTAAMLAAALAGTPMVAVDGPGGSDELVVKPGLLIHGAKMTPLDLSQSLRAIMEYNEALRNRLSENTRIPPEVLGRVKGAQQPSGIKVALSFGPLRGLIEEMRLVRKEKYGLLLKFTQRMQTAGGWWKGEVLDANVTFGSFLPSDQSATIDAVLKLYEAHVISRKTAIGRLVEEGIIQVDLAEELEACEAEDFAAALAYFEATEDTDGVFELLHRDPPEEEPETQQINLRLPPGQPPPNGQAPVAPVGVER